MTMLPKDRIKVLDGLRALAILHVMALHIAWEIYFQTDGNLALGNLKYPAWFIMNGWVGVQLFFVLSGYLIARQLINRDILVPEKRKPFIISYLKRRFLRLAPVYYFFLIAFLYANFDLYIAEHKETEFWIYQVLSHLFFMQDYIPALSTIAGFWSLAVEAKFYLLAPFIVWVMLNLPRTKCYSGFLLLFSFLLIVKIGFILFSAPVTDPKQFFQEIRAPFHMVADGLLAGMLCSFLWSDEKIRTYLDRPLIANAMFVAGFSLFVGLCALTKPYYWPGGINFFSEVFFTSLIVFAFSLMLLGLLGKCAGFIIWESKILRYIALISYSLYLVHFMFIGEATRWAYLIAGDTGSAGLIWLVGFILLFAVSAPLAALSYRYIELPFITLGKKEHLGKTGQVAYALAKDTSKNQSGIK